MGGCWATVKKNQPTFQHRSNNGSVFGQVIELEVQEHFIVPLHRMPK